MKVNRYKEYEFAADWASVSQICGIPAKEYLYGWYAKYGQEAYRINEHSKKIGALIDNEICHYFGDKDTPELDKTVLEHNETNEYYLQAIRNFHTAVEYLQPTSILGQQVVYSKEHKYIGTFDRLLVIDNKLVLSDWKATNFLDYGYRMQLEAYYRALTEMLDNGILSREVVKQYEWHEYPLWIVQFPKKEKIDLEKNIIKFKSKDTTWNNFLSLLSFYYGKQQDEQEIKENQPKRKRRNKSDK